MSFKKILGQDKAIKALQGFIDGGRVPRSMIFYGPSGVGKATAALEFAKALNCLDSSCAAQFDSCGFCQNCKHIDANTHPDIIFAGYAFQAALLDEELEKQQSMRVETIRKLTASCQQKPVFAKWKVYIIDNAEKLIPAAANALLKFIEEPPPNTVWIFISSKKEVMLSTIKSRCQLINFAPLTADIVRNILQEKFIESSIAEKAAFYGEGSITKAVLAADILSDFAGLEGGAAFAHQAAESLPKVLSEARTSANAMLDMLSVTAHQQWLSAAGARRDGLRDLLSKIVFYKKAINRNVSPSLVVQAAFIAAQEQQAGFDF